MLFCLFGRQPNNSIAADDFFGGPNQILFDPMCFILLIIYWLLVSNMCYFLSYHDDSRDFWKRVLETRFPPTKELSNLSSNLSSNPGDLPEFLGYSWLLRSEKTVDSCRVPRWNTLRCWNASDWDVASHVPWWRTWRGSIDQRNIWKMGLGKIIWYINIITNMGFDTFITIPWFSWYWW